MENEYQLAVEDEISKRHKKPNVDGKFKCTLQKISLESVKGSSLYPLSDSKMFKSFYSPLKLGMEKEHQLAVEDEISQRHKEQDVDVEFICTLQRISVELVKKLSLYPLSKSDDYPDKCSPFPGVYLIYYNGETSLYGNQVHPSKDKPIYVGKSETSVYKRLNQHYLRLNEAKDLQVQDFKVRFMGVDVSNFAPCIEGLLIEYYEPFWNCSKGSEVNLSFGNSQSNSNNWYKYHISQDKETIERVDGVKPVESTVLPLLRTQLAHVFPFLFEVLPRDINIEITIERG